MNLERLSRLALRVRRGPGDRPGDRRFPGRPQPTGVEIEAYRPYAAGDDLRHLDWNVLGRLDALVVRRFTAEREVVVHLLVDGSASMGVPARDDKLGVAKALALALAWVALATNDAVRVALLAGDGAVASPAFRQRASVGRVREALAGAVAVGSVALGAALAAYARRHARAGVALVVSDLMMEPADVEAGLHALRARGWETVLLHVLARGELDPGRDFARALLRDVETGATRPVALTPPVVERYRAVLAAHLAALEAAAARTGTVYARLVSDESLLDFVTGDLARLGVIRRR